MKCASIVLSLALLAVSTAGGATPLAPPEPTTRVNEIAEGYVKLVLAMGLHDPDYVDAYYGPQEWKKPEKKPLDTIAREATRLREQLAKISEPADELERLRRSYLTKQLSALEARVRQELRQWLRRLHDELHVTSVFVTHDQEEAFEVADRVVIMNHGRIEQTGSPEDIFEHPANPFVMDFLGNVNVFQGVVQAGRARLGDLEVAYPEYPHAESRAATAFIRSHELEIVRKRNGRPSLEVKVTHVNPARPVVKVRVYSETFGVVLTVDVSWERYAELQPAVGDTVYVSPRQLRVFVQDYAI